MTKKDFLLLIKNHIYRSLRPQTLAVTLCAFLALNIFWQIAGAWIFISRSYLDLDYLLVLAILPFSLTLSFLAALVVFIQEYAMNNALAFHFTDISAFFSSWQFANNLQLSAMIQPHDLILFAAYLITLYLVFKFSRPHISITACVVVMCLGVAADRINGSNYTGKTQTQILPGNIAGSSFLSLATAIRDNLGPPKPASILPPDQQIMSAKVLDQWLLKHPDRSVLFIILESYGLHEDSRINDYLAERVKTPTLQSIYNIKYGTLPFAGATTSAELRHLCNLSANYSTPLQESDTTECLPSRAIKHGLKVIGAHGFSSQMFRRNVWWPYLGLTTNKFADAYQKEGAPFCGSGLYGICDEYILDDLLNETTRQRGFYYQLTLNTHFPVVRVPLTTELKTICADQQAISDNVCAYTGRLGQFFDHLANALAKLKSPPLVLMVGDHAPPFTDQESRRYSGGVTPFFILDPK
jgi:hypothetical protein